MGHSPTRCLGAPPDLLWNNRISVYYLRAISYRSALTVLPLHRPITQNVSVYLASRSIRCGSTYSYRVPNLVLSNILRNILRAATNSIRSNPGNMTMATPQPRKQTSLAIFLLTILILSLLAVAVAKEQNTESHHKRMSKPKFHTLTSLHKYPH